MEELQLDEKRILEVLEPIRKKRNVVIFIVLGSFLGTVVCVLGSALIGNSEAAEFGSFFAGMAVFAICSMILGKIQKQYNSEYKDLISKHVLKACFDDAKYDPLKGFSPKEFRDAHFMQWRDVFRYASEDFIAGRYAGVEFEQSDVQITHESGSGKNRHTVVDVDGRMTKFHYKKTIKSPILIVKTGYRVLLETDLSKVEMEDVDFNEKFEVYSQDGHSVYYLLTPPFMEYLKDLAKLDRHLYIRFDGENLYILRSGKGGIFVPPGGKLDIHAEVEKSKQELSEINKMIEILKLEDKEQMDKISAVQDPTEAFMEMEEKPYVMSQIDVKESKKNSEVLKLLIVFMIFAILIIITLVIYYSQ